MRPSEERSRRDPSPEEQEAIRSREVREEKRRLRGKNECKSNMVSHFVRRRNKYKWVICSRGFRTKTPFSNFFSPNIPCPPVPPASRPHRVHLLLQPREGGVNRRVLLLPSQRLRHHRSRQEGPLRVGLKVKEIPSDDEQGKNMGKNWCAFFLNTV